jgi:hypothetical protein
MHFSGGCQPHWPLCEKLHCHTCHMIFIVTFPIRFLKVLTRRLVPSSTGNELLIVGLRIVSPSILASSTVSGGVSPTSSNSAASSTAINCPAQSFSTVQIGNYTYEIECMFLKRRCIRRTMANPKPGGYQYQGGDLGIPVGMVANSFYTCIQVCLRNYSFPSQSELTYGHRPATTGTIKVAPAIVCS